MLNDPFPNDPDNPLLSICIYNYDIRYLRSCLESIFQQDIIENFEVIIVDDATSDGSWEIACEFVDKYSNKITINRNRIVFGPQHNLSIAKKLAKGRYGTYLTNNQVFSAEYLKSCMGILSVDPYADFQFVFRIEDERILPPSISNVPLVSIQCYNFNYGRYLNQCLESVFTQTYENIELCFSDNASTDESWQIALQFARKYPRKTYLTRNRKNFGSDANFSNTQMNRQGKYFVNFCSDDALEPTFVEKCVEVLEAHPNVGLVIVNREIIDERGKRTSEPPFYNQSCIIPGEEQAAVYMMAGINPSVSQIMYRSSTIAKRSATGSLVSKFYGTRILDFNISLDFDIAYINQPLMLHRVHSQSDTQHSDSKMLPILGMYVLNHQFADKASVRNLKKVVDRLPMSIQKLAKLSIRYSFKCLLEKNEKMAIRYFYLAIAMNDALCDDDDWKMLKKYWTMNYEQKQVFLEKYAIRANLKSRSCSYDPPSGSFPLSFD